MLRSQIYVCPVCGNIIHSMGEAVIHCHGVSLTPYQAEESDEHHKIFIEKIEDDYYVRIEHDNLISFCELKVGFRLSALSYNIA